MRYSGDCGLLLLLSSLSVLPSLTLKDPAWPLCFSCVFHIWKAWVRGEQTQLCQGGKQEKGPFYPVLMAQGCSPVSSLKLGESWKLEFQWRAFRSWCTWSNSLLSFPRSHRGPEHRWITCSLPVPLLQSVLGYNTSLPHCSWVGGGSGQCHCSCRAVCAAAHCNLHTA